MESCAKAEELMNKETRGGRNAMQLFEVTATPISGGRAHILLIMARDLEHAHRRARALLPEVFARPDDDYAVGCSGPEEFVIIQDCKWSTWSTIVPVIHVGGSRATEETEGTNN